MLRRRHSHVHWQSYPKLRWTPIRYAVASSLPHRPTKQISVTQPKPRDFGTSWMSTSLVLS
jgi:hypothetical protein